MIKHTAGGQEASAGCEPHHYHRNNRSPPSMSPPGSMFTKVEDARDWPEDREIDGTLCRRLSPEYFAWLRSACSRPKPRTRPESSPRMPGTLRKRFNALQALAIREFGKELLQEVLHSFSPKNYQPPALRPEPQGNPSKFPERTGFIPEPSLEM